MKSIVEIESVVEFVLVGPRSGSSIGVLLSSKSIGIDLVGLANIAYYHGNEYSGIEMAEEQIGVKTIWSQLFTTGNRKQRYLFCYRVDPNFLLDKNNSNLPSKEDVNKTIFKELNRFIEDSTKDISTFRTRSYKSISEYVDEAALLWNISPLLLSCMIDSKK